MAGDRDGGARADLGADRLGQDARGVPVGAGSAGRGRERAFALRPPRAAACGCGGGFALRPPRAAACGRRHRAHTPRLRLPPEGALVRHRAQPAGAVEGHRRGPARGDPHGRHAAERSRADAARAAGRPDHDAGVALPDADEQSAGDPARRGVGDRRRDPRGRRHEARRASRADAGATRRARAGAASRPRGPAHRPLGDAEPVGGGRALHGRPAAQMSHRRHRRAQAARLEDPRAGRVDGRAGRGGGRERGPGPRPALRRHRGDAPLDLAGDLPGAAEGDPGPPLHDPLRQQPPLRRADRAAAERAGQRR